MGQIPIRATYDDGNLRGSIRVSEIAKQIPAEYQGTLFDNRKGVLKTFSMPSMHAVIAKATGLGFQAHLWSIQYLSPQS